jgi:hypothetical protein
VPGSGNKDCAREIVEEKMNANKKASTHEVRCMGKNLSGLVDAGANEKSRVPHSCERAK